MMFGMFFANAFSALAGGTAAVFATRVRFFQKQGYDATIALSSGAIMTTSSWIAITVLFLISLPFAWGSIHLDTGEHLSGDSKLVWVILAVVVIVALAAGLVLAVTCASGDASRRAASTSSLEGVQRLPQERVLRS